MLELSKNVLALMPCSVREISRRTVLKPLNCS